VKLLRYVRVLSDRLIDRDLAVETTRTKQGGVKYIGLLVAASTMMPLSPLKPSISTSKLVEGAFAFVVAHDGVLPRCTADGVDLIDENIQGAFSRACLKRSRTRLAPTHKEFHKIGTAHGEEGDLCFTGHGFGQ